VDRADEAFEALLLEVLSDFQVSVPEIGTVSADVAPIVVITSNRTRGLSDALKRRCLYLYIEPPDYEKERTIVERKVPELEAALVDDVVGFVQGLRGPRSANSPASRRRSTGRGPSRPTTPRGRPLGPGGQAHARLPPEGGR